jgi:hypothetical protein
MVPGRGGPRSPGPGCLESDQHYPCAIPLRGGTRWRPLAGRTGRSEYPWQGMAGVGRGEWVTGNAVYGVTRIEGSNPSRSATALE